MQAKLVDVHPIEVLVHHNVEFDLCTNALTLIKYAGLAITLRVNHYYIYWFYLATRNIENISSRIDMVL